MCLPSRTLLPVLTYDETYVRLATPPREYPESIKQTTLQSSGRLTPTCIFTQFQGPNFQSKQIITMSPGNEAIFVKLPDYTYHVQWNLQGAYFKFWTVNIERDLAYQVYTTSGKLAETTKKKGEFCIYGFNFPIVVELPFGAQLELTVTLGRYLARDDPLVVGNHCLIKNCTQRFVYENVANASLKQIIRVVAPDLAVVNANIRREYLSIFREPCRGITSPLNNAIQTITINSTPTVTAYNALVFLNFVSTFGGDCTDPLWASINSAEMTPLTLTNTLGIDEGSLASYGYVTATGTLQFNLNIVITYAHAIFQTEYGCGNLYVGFGVYSTLKLLKQIDGTNAAILPDLVGNTATFTGFLQVPVKEKQYLWFGGYGLIDVGNGMIEGDPVAITGTITCQYV